MYLVFWFHVSSDVLFVSSVMISFLRCIEVGWTHSEIFLAYYDSEFS